MKKRKLKKRVKDTIVISFFLVVIFIGTLIVIFDVKNEEKKEEKKEEKEEYQASEYYHEFVQIREDTTLYQKEGKQYQEVGTIYKGVNVSLMENTDNSKYFKIKDTEYYVFYDSFSESEEEKKDISYQRWIPFNENIEGENITLLKNDEKIMTLTEKLSLPIYRKTENEYYVEYQGSLYTVNKDITIVEKENSSDIKAEEVSVLNYHFFYDPEVETCNQIICHTKSQFISHLDYLKENNYITLTAEELKMFLKGEINVPKTSIVITIDDGYLAHLGVDLLTEYQMYATLFLITDWYDPKEFETEYVKVESHSHNMHNTGVCSGGQGGAIKCWPDEQILEDLKKSQDRIGGSTVFCYPFYEYTNHSIELLKQAGFEMAFIGGNRKAKPGVDLFQIPRYVIGSDTTLEDFKKKL